MEQDRVTPTKQELAACISVIIRAAMTRYRVATYPTRAKTGPWRATRREALHDAVDMGLAERDEHEPDRIYLDVLVEIEEDAGG